MKVLITGANGQLGQALAALYPDAILTDVAELDITSRDSVMSYDFSGVNAILNAAAYTNVDGAETTDGRPVAWTVNASAVANLSAAATKRGLTLVHISTDYVFDGTKEPHLEEETLSPLSVYGTSKAAGDIAASMTEQYYIVRTSWVIGEGKNFVRTMLGLAEKGVEPTVVGDQTGRPTFTSDLAKGIKHLLDNESPYGTYNLTNGGGQVSWAEFTREIFKTAGYDKLKVTDTTTEEYYRGKEGIAPRPLRGTLDLAKITEAGYTPRDWREALDEYIAKEAE